MTNEPRDEHCQGDSVERDAARWLEELPGVDREIEMAHMRLKRLGQETTRMLTVIAQHHGLTFGDWETLSMLRRSGEPYVMTPSELVQALNVTSGTISVRIERLIQAGLLEPADGRGDGRSRPVRLTEEGARRWSAATDERTSLEARLYTRAIDPEEIPYLNLLLGALLCEMEAEMSDDPD
ncbi:MAG: MarR family transcriptional regulator [Nitrolancea sp.]